MSKGKTFFNKWDSKNSLFVIWVGYNDNDNILKKKETATEINEIVERMFNVIEDIHKVGARNILIMNVLPKYNCPASSKEIKDFLKQNILLFNKMLINNSERIFKIYNNLNIFVYDIFKRFENIINNYSKYGFKDCVNSIPKGKNLNNYLWIKWHITDLRNKIIAEDM